MRIEAIIKERVLKLLRSLPWIENEKEGAGGMSEELIPRLPLYCLKKKDTR